VFVFRKKPNQSNYKENSDFKNKTDLSHNISQKGEDNHFMMQKLNRNEKARPRR